MIRLRPVRLALLAVGAALVGPALLAGAERRRERAERSDRAPTPASAASAAPGAPASGLEAFDILMTRNIFDPNRVGRTRAAPEEKPPRVEEISLVGTLEYEKGRIAFFDSPDAAFRKTLRAGESVADFRVQRIDQDGVELLRGESAFALKVTQQLRRPEGGDWTVHAPPPEPSAAKRPAETAAAAGVPADASEALKRLMEKRKQQLK